MLQIGIEVITDEDCCKLVTLYSSSEGYAAKRLRVKGGNRYDFKCRTFDEKNVKECKCPFSVQFSRRVKTDGSVCWFVSRNNFCLEHIMCNNNNDEEQQEEEKEHQEEAYQEPLLILTSSKEKYSPLFLINKDEFIAKFMDKYEVDHAQLHNILKMRALLQYDDDDEN
jgi:hypothetical protein